MSSEEKPHFQISDLLPGIPRDRQMSGQRPGIGEEERVRFRELNKQLGYYRGKQSQLENLLKTITAKLMEEARVNNIKSQAAQKVYAEAHDDRLEIIEALSTCVNLVSILWSEIDLFKIDIEMWRTKEASNRHEKNSYN